MKDRTLKDIVVEICKIVKSVNMDSPINVGGLFNRQKDDMAEVLKALKNEKENAEQFCTDLIESEKKVKESKINLDGLVRECDELREKIEERELTIDNQGLTIKDLKDVNKINQSSISSLTTKNKHQEEMISQLNGEAKEDEKAIATQHDQIVELEKISGDKTDRIVELVETIKEKDEQIENQSDEILRLNKIIKDERHSTSVEFLELKNENKRLTTNISKNNATYQERIDKVRTESDKLRKERDHFLSELELYRPAFWSTLITATITALVFGYFYIF